MLALSYLYLKGNILLKIVPFTTFLVISVLVYNTINYQKGWPLYTDTLEGQVVAIVVNSDRERIILWVREPAKVYDSWLYNNFLFHDTFSGRLFEIPYTEDNEKQANWAQKAIQDGLIVTIGPTGISGNGEESEGGEEGSGVNGHGSGGDSSLQFIITSPDQILKK